MMNYYGETSPEMSALEKANAALARRAAAESFVLLKNEKNTLPLQAGKIALYGMGARKTIMGGEGSGEVNPRYRVSVEEGLENAGCTITTKTWLNDYDEEYAATYEEYRQMVEEKIAPIKNPMAQIPAAHSYKYLYPSGRAITAADVAASGTDTAVFVLMRQAGECTDRKNEKGDFQLTDLEVENLRFLAVNYRHVALIINVGGLVDLSVLDEVSGIGAVVYMAQGGSEGGNALADVLLGKCDFSGRLADSWPMRYAQIPDGENFSSLNGDTDNEWYTEGIYVGYRYFDSFGVAPRWPFGFGLSYTTFAENCEDVTLDGGKVTARVSVANTGRVAGRQVVQAYLSVPGDAAQSLAAFGKTALLAPGESETLTLCFDLGDQSIYCEECSAWMLPQGEYRLHLGVNSRDTKTVAALTLNETVKIVQCRKACAPAKPIDEIRPAAAVPPALPAEVVCLTIDPAAFAAQAVDYAEPSVPESAKVKETLDRLTTTQQVELLRGGDLQNQTPGQHQITGAGGKTNITLLEQGVPNVVFSDGPAGVNIVEEIIVLEDGSIKPAKMIERYNWGLMKQLAKRMVGGEGQHVYRYATAWPVEALLAQSWDTALLGEIGAGVGAELAAFGITLWLAPAMNIHRNPLCGRNFEYYSEDPLLTGKMAAALTRGVQSHNGVGVTIKHFCCNNQEDNRVAVSENLSEKALRQIYLRGFEIAIKESAPLALMTSYNKLNSIYTGERYDLITDILHCEWGYTGLTMTDWGTGYDAAQALIAGVDMMMPGDTKDTQTVLAAIENGAVTPAQVRRSAARVLALVEQSQTAELQKRFAVKNHS